MDHDPLAEIIEAETYAEMLRLLTLTEMGVALLRAEGHSDAEIARQLGVSRSTVTRWMFRARRRIAPELPGAARWLKGRQRRWRRSNRRKEGEGPC
jgi:DNA-directed RNA polymerase specialized sigma24 family protein